MTRGNNEIVLVLEGVDMLVLQQEEEHILGMEETLEEHWSALFDDE